MLIFMSSVQFFLSPQELSGSASFHADPVLDGLSQCGSGFETLITAVYISIVNSKYLLMNIFLSEYGGESWKQYNEILQDMLNRVQV